MNRPFALLVAVMLVIGCNSAPAPTSTPNSSEAPTSSPSAAITPAPTLPPSPGASNVPPTATPGASAALVVDKALIEGHLDALQAIADANVGTRAAGTSGYDASADYVEQVMTGLGYQVERHSFDFPFSNEAEPVTLTVGANTWTSPEWLHASLYSASGDVQGTLQLIGLGGVTNGCDQSDWNTFTAGNIAVVYGGGGCYSRQKVELAQDAGALAIISMYPAWEMNQIRRPTLIDPAGITIPVIAAGREPADALAGLDGQTAQLSANIDTHTATVDNIIATLPGESERIVMLGGHLDSVLEGPGINDNGSGVATLMAMAASVAAQPQAHSTIRFGFWSAEEFGDLGSKAYVDALNVSEHSLIDAYLNLDMVGSPNPGRYVYDEPGMALGSDALTQRLLVAFEALGATATTTNTGGASDHFWFGNSGIPIGGVFSGLAPMTAAEADLFDGVANEPEDPCYHLACDTTANVDFDMAQLMGQVVANVLADLAY